MCIVNVHKVAKNPEVLRKQYVSTEKTVEVPKNFMTFLTTLVIALPIHVRIMSIVVAQCRYLLLIKGFSQHYKIGTLFKTHLQKEIELSVL